MLSVHSKTNSNMTLNEMEQVPSHLYVTSPTAEKGIIATIAMITGIASVQW